MKFKLLERTDTRIDVEDANISFRMGHLKPEDVSEMQGIMRSSNNAAVAVAIYAMRHCFSEMTIEGEAQENPARLSYQIDPANPETEAGLVLMGAKIIEEVILTDEARKKLASQRKTSSQAKKVKTAKTAPSSESN